MRSASVVIAAAAVVVLVLAVTALAATEKHQVTSLPGLAQMAETQYTGYVQVNAEKDANLFFWLFQSRNKPSTDPLVLWMTGGPGCSSELAVLFENGPYVLDNSAGTLKFNPNSWNMNANLLFIDQPVDTGFSYASSEYVRDEDGVADDMYTFLQGFMQLFPEYQNRAFYLTGESYAGHYVPAVGQRIIFGNAGKTGISINLQGLAIGNGWIDPYLQYPAYIPFGLDNGLIDQSTADRLNATARHCQSLINDKLWDLANIECSTIMSRIAGDLNVYNIHEKCTYPPLCYDFRNQTSYMNSAGVQTALNVKRSWSTCNDEVNMLFKASDRLESFRPDVAFALKNNLRVLIYNGKLDLICNWEGGRDTADTIQWSGNADFAKTPYKPFSVGGSVAGQFKTFGPLTFMAVEGAGHMVPHDQPQAAFVMITRFLSDQPYGQ